MMTAERRYEAPQAAPCHVATRAFGVRTNEVWGGLNNRAIARRYDSFGRPAGYDISGVNQTTLAYDPATGRLASMASNGEGTFTWTYLPGTDLKATLAYPNGATRTVPYETARDLVTAITNNFNNPNVPASVYAYANDLLGRRTAKNGEAYAYNARNELIGATNAAAATAYAYAFDDIGNRSTAAERGVASAYAANNLNQYTNILSGLAPFSPEFDLDGNQTLIRTSTGVWTVTYNGENRPVSWTCGITNIVMAYDRMGRRVVCDMSVSGSLAESKRFAYDNYLLVQENDLATSNRSQATSQSFVWDPTEPVATKPLATSHQPQATSYYYVHDGNKNVSALVAAQPAQPALLASYVYAPFGAVTASSGALTTVNPFRFSSEYADDTLGLVYYNYRHYNPTDGRWTSRDPIDEDGGINLFLYCQNNAKMENWDCLGLDYLDCLGECIAQNDPLDVITDSFIGQLTVHAVGGYAGIPKSILVWLAEKKGDKELARVIKMSMKNGSPVGGRSK